jgi:uncharacterized protein YutE (UPF0331/DUF86 family)
VTPRALDSDIVGRRLRLLRDALDDLAELRGVTAERLTTEPLTRAAAERLIQVAVDLAIDINGHVAVATAGRAPTTGRESFELAAQAGALDASLADRLAPSAGLRNLLVHRYVDIRVDLVAAAVDEVLDGFDDYVADIARFVSRAADAEAAGAPGDPDEPPPS